MKFIKGLIIFFFLYGVSSAEVKSEYWQIKKSTHFVVYYKTVPSLDYVDELIKTAESYYDTITERLGFRRFDFWTWDKRCKIYLYSSSQEYYNETKQPHWSGGYTVVRKRIIATFLYEKDFFERVLPHEMGHLIFREFVGYDTELPLWLDEGIACLQEGKHTEEYLVTAKGLVMSNLFITLEQLTKIKQEGLVMPRVFYAESASSIEFLLRKYDKEKFVDYCRNLRDKKDWEVALKGIYGFKSISDMNREWVESLK